MRRAISLVLMAFALVFISGCSTETKTTGKVTKVMGLIKTGHGAQFTVKLTKEPMIMPGANIPTTVEVHVEGMDKPLILTKEQAVTFGVAEFGAAGGYKTGVSTILDETVEISQHKKTNQLISIKKL